MLIFWWIRKNTQKPKAKLTGGLKEINKGKNTQKPKAKLTGGSKEINKVPKCLSPFKIYSTSELEFLRLAESTHGEGDKFRTYF